MDSGDPWRAPPAAPPVDGRPGPPQPPAWGMANRPVGLPRQSLPLRRVPAAATAADGLHPAAHPTPGPGPAPLSAARRLPGVRARRPGQLGRHHRCDRGRRAPAPPATLRRVRGRLPAAEPALRPTLAAPGRLGRALAGHGSALGPLGALASCGWYPGSRTMRHYGSGPGLLTGSLSPVKRSDPPTARRTDGDPTLPTPPSARRDGCTPRARRRFWSPPAGWAGSVRRRAA
jgi:hypothetical protein